MIFTQNKKLVFASLLVLIAGCIFALPMLFRSGEPREASIACTMDALICPDGSGVGRTGPSCTFMPCPSNGSLEGVFIRDGEGSRLIVSSAKGVGTGVTYAVPLRLDDVEIANDESGKSMKLIGTFIEGNMFQVVRVEESSIGSIPGVHTGVVAVGESRLLGGVRITVNRVVSDSRCPVDVTCVWAGEITASVTLESDTDSETLDLSSGKLPHGFDAYQVSILGADPEMRTTVRINPSEYQLMFKVEKLAS